MAAPSIKVIEILMISVFCLSDVCILHVKGADFFVTTPPAIDGVLTSCGETRLTCSHDNVPGENTRWRITRMDLSRVCQVTIDHTTPTPETPYSCNEFRFEDITALMTGANNNNISDLNSTAMVNPLPLDLSGSRMECTAGSLSTSSSVGSVTLCVIDPLFRPIDVRSDLLPNNLTSVVLEWGTQPTCSRDTVSYTIAIDGVDAPPENISVSNDTRYIVSGLEANRMYAASVKTVISNCISDQSNLTFQIIAKTPTPVNYTRFFCSNSSDSITLVLSWMFPSIAPSGVVYPPTSELSVAVSVSNSSGLVSNNTFPGSQSDAFFNLGNNGSYTISMVANHATTGSSTPRTILLTTSIFDVDSSTTSQDDRVTVRLNSSCVENPTTFISTLSYGSCPNYITFQESQTFSSSGTAVFELDANSVTGNLCIRVVVAHQSQPNLPLNTLEQQLTFSPCPIADIISLAGSRISVQLSSNETSGMVPHGTIATFRSSSSAYTLVGPEQSTCRNRRWTNQVERQTKLAGWVIAIIVIVILLALAVAVGGVIGYLVWHAKSYHRERSKDIIELNEKEKLDDADGDPVNHEHAPTGDEYAVVDTSSKKKAVASENQAFYQDPASIQHETAPTGDVYAVTEKKPKKKGPTEAELAQMYSVPDKNKGAGLTYASLDMPGGGGGSETSKRPAPTEYATVIN